MKSPDYSFQKNIEKEVVDNLMKYGKCLLAGAPASGKTEMAINIITTMKKFGFSSLVLAHGTKVLRNQFMQRLDEYGISHGSMDDDGLIVTLPQSVKKMHKVDMMVIDEAHHYYSKDMVQNIIKKLKPKYILLLTGSPGLFNSNSNLPKVYVSSDDLLSYNVITSPKVLLLTINDELNLSDIKSDAISDDYKYSDKSVEKVIKDAVKSVGKSMIVCKDINHANQVGKILKAHNSKFLISTYKSDLDSKAIDMFRSSKHKFLIVVRRGILGFSMNNLQNVYDFSGSVSIDFQYQLLNRLTRLGENTKKYIKVCNEDMFDYYYSSLNAACALIIKEFYKSYSTKGYNNNKFSFPILKEYKANLDKQTKAKINNGISIDIEFLIKHNSDNGVFATTTLNNIRKIYHDRFVWTIKTATEVSKLYKSRKEMGNSKHGSALNFLYKYPELLDRLFPKNGGISYEMAKSMINNVINSGLNRNLAKKRVAAAIKRYPDLKIYLEKMIPSSKKVVIYKTKKQVIDAYDECRKNKANSPNSLLIAMKKFLTKEEQIDLHNKYKNKYTIDMVSKTIEIATSLNDISKNELTWIKKNKLSHLISHLPKGVVYGGKKTSYAIAMEIIKSNNKIRSKDEWARILKCNIKNIYHIIKNHQDFAEYCSN